MVSKFMVVWVILSAFVYTWIFIMERDDKQSTQKHLMRVAASSMIAMMMVIPLFFLNNVSGV